ncbi:MAG: hypothetical protein ACFFDY_01030 [Candidatus Thorarchaeota archaeon]
MIEIGPNLKIVLLNILDKLDENGALTASYIDVLDKIKEITFLLPGTKLYEYDKHDDKKYPSDTSTIKTEPCNIPPELCPTESGYYWFKKNGTKNKVVVHYITTINTTFFIGQETGIHNNNIEKFGYYIQPIIPILEPECILYNNKIL